MSIIRQERKWIVIGIILANVVTPFAWAFLVWITSKSWPDMSVMYSFAGYACIPEFFLGMLIQKEKYAGAEEYLGVFIGVISVVAIGGVRLWKLTGSVPFGQLAIVAIVSLVLSLIPFMIFGMNRR